MSRKGKSAKTKNDDVVVKVIDSGTVSRDDVTKEEHRQAPDVVDGRTQDSMTVVLGTDCDEKCAVCTKPCGFDTTLETLSSIGGCCGGDVHGAKREPVVTYVYPDDNIDATDDFGEVFTSTLNVIDDPLIIVPDTILDVCDQFAAHIKDEWSILVKADWGNDAYRLGEEFYVFKQEVTGASVDPLEDLAPFREMGYNAIIHCHPFPSKSFSHSDDNTINCHFPCSILYSDGDFTAATLSFDVREGVKLRLKSDVVVERIHWVQFDEALFDQIQQKPRTYSYQYGSYDARTKKFNYSDRKQAVLDDKWNDDRKWDNGWNGI